MESQGMLVGVTSLIKDAFSFGECLLEFLTLTSRAVYRSAGVWSRH